MDIFKGVGISGSDFPQKIKVFPLLPVRVLIEMMSLLIILCPSGKSV